MQNVSVLGLGAMGSAIAHTLLDQGYKVTVWNRTAAKADPLVAAGAVLASTWAEAIASNPISIVCIGSHGDTRRLLETTSDLSGKTIVEVSTGDRVEAEALVASVKANGGDCLVGMILTYPSGIGKADKAILIAGEETSWIRCQPIIRTLAGDSDYIGDQVGALAVLFAALFLPRQGFMFGMIYGSLLCEKAGVPIDAYIRQLPQTLKVAGDYIGTVAATIPDDSYADSKATVNVYDAAFRDALASFHDLDANSEFPDLMHSLVKRGVDSGFGEEDLTALIKMLR